MHPPALAPNLHFPFLQLQEPSGLHQCGPLPLGLKHPTPFPNHSFVTCSQRTDLRQGFNICWWIYLANSPFSLCWTYNISVYGRASACKPLYPVFSFEPEPKIQAAQFSLSSVCKHATLHNQPDVMGCSFCQALVPLIVHFTPFEKVKQQLLTTRWRQFLRVRIEYCFCSSWDHECAL